jgi:hypothetical protein
LRHFACGQIRAESDAAPAFIVGDFQHQRAAGVIVPGFHRIDTVPVRALATRQQEVDCSGSGTSVRAEALIAKSLAIVAAFRMRL